MGRDCVNLGTLKLAVEPGATACPPEAGLQKPHLFRAAVFRDLRDLVFRNKQIWLDFAPQPRWVFVVVFDALPAHGLAVQQLDVHQLLPVSQRFEKR